MAVLSGTLYVSIELDAGAELRIPEEHIERAPYPVSGDLLIDGEPPDGLRFVWWNFVSSSRERIERAKADWQSGRLAVVPGETEFIPLPE